MDFLPGYKTNSGLVIAVLSVALAKYATTDQIIQIITNIGQIIGACLATYGMIMKIVRDVKAKQTQNLDKGL